MEGTHGQLGARFADGLCGDHADCFTHVHQTAAAQIAAIALGAQTVTRIAGQRGAHAHFVDAQRLDAFHLVFVQQGTGLVQRLAGFRIDHIGS